MTILWRMLPSVNTPQPHWTCSSHMPMPQNVPSIAGKFSWEFCNTIWISNKDERILNKETDKPDKHIRATYDHEGHEMRTKVIGVCCGLRRNSLGLTSRTASPCNAAISNPRPVH
ncbi:hypothetical protein ACRALDRAFT_212128 [Sodiomyces alcalophilus JCM 7366]|uniref:uncharacterized protein n=1 Tax=Sodiomyces alcalophilus JCM 7366 TaxID=591952 RepID=UPI0039B5DBDB